MIKNIIKMSRKPLKSKFECRNPEKYVGNPDVIVCRSSWERYFCSILDSNSSIEKWGSEEIAIPYRSPIDAFSDPSKLRRYFVDFVVKFKDGRVILFEVKPYSQTIPPIVPKTKGQKAMARYAEELRTYQVNIAKWQAARKFCEERGFKFEIITENELRKLGAPI